MEHPRRYSGGYSDEKESREAAAEPTNFSQGDVTTSGSDDLPLRMADGDPSSVEDVDVARQDHSSTPSRGPQTRSQDQ